MKELRFIVDTNVGHLARKLRMLGYDTLFVNPVEDTALIQIAEKEDRIILSGDSRLFERRVVRTGKVKAFFVDTYYPSPEKQLRQIMQRFGLEVHLPFLRCFECNTPLVQKTREEAKGKVPPFVYQRVESYQYCPQCRQFFWEGDHVKRMKAFMEKL